MLRVSLPDVLNFTEPVRPLEFGRFCEAPERSGGGAIEIGNVEFLKVRAGVIRPLAFSQPGDPEILFDIDVTNAL
jgi:hypothetical protein